MGGVRDKKRANVLLVVYIGEGGCMDMGQQARMGRP